MKQFLVLLLSLLFSFESFSQENCEYAPLQLDDIMPIWEHLVIDTSIIGYVDTSAFWSDGDDFYNGMNHLTDFYAMDDLVHDGMLYSFTGVDFDIDLAGFIMEKIDIETGELLWKNLIDPRTEDYEFKVLDSEIKDDELHLYGVRTIADNNAIIGFLQGWEYSHQFRRVYDITDGELLREYTPETLDEGAVIVQSFNGSHYNFFKDDYWEILNLTVWIDSGSVLTRQLIDTFGYELTPEETVVLGDWNSDWDSELVTGVLSTFGKLAEGPDNTYSYIQQYITQDEDPRESKVNITIYDEEFNVRNKTDLTPYLQEDFEGVANLFFTSDRIVLRAYYKNESGYDIIILDNELNLTNYIDCKIGDERPRFFGNQFLDNSNELYFYSLGVPYTSEGLNFFKIGAEDILDPIRHFDIRNDEWGAVVTNFKVLDNGDFLIKVNYGCVDQNQFGPTYLTWMRIDKSEFETMLNINDESFQNNSFTLYPNPAESAINIQGDASNIAKINIYDLMGRQIMTTTNLNNIDIRNLLSGYYLVSISDKSGRIEHHKLSKN